MAHPYQVASTISQPRMFSEADVADVERFWEENQRDLELCGFTREEFVGTYKGS